jgi:hypothetical protein
MLLLLQVVSGLSSLEELALGNTRISGSLTCDLPASLKVRLGQSSVGEPVRPACIQCRGAGVSLAVCSLAAGLLCGKLPMP